MRNFRELEIWKNAISMARSIYLLTDDFPINEKYGLISQIQRASVSIASNIAEGSSRKSEKDFTRFLEISIGSAFEVETQLIIAKEIGYINDEQFSIIHGDLIVLQKQISKLITVIRQ